MPLSLSLFVCLCRCRGWATGASAFECQRKPQRYNLDKRLLFKYVRCHPRRILEYPHTPLRSHTHLPYILTSRYVISWSGAPLLSDRQCVWATVRGSITAPSYMSSGFRIGYLFGSRSGSEYGLRLWTALDWIGLCLAYCYLHRAWQAVMQDSRAVCSAHGEGKLIMHCENV